MFKIQLARQGQTMEQGTLVVWNAAEGDEIQVGDALYEIETEKAVVPIEATRPGRILKLITEVGQTVPVGAVLALVAEPGENVSPDQLAAAIRAASAASGDDADADTADIPSSGGVNEGAAANAAPAKITAMPKARALAAELGVALESVKGSGPNGMIVPEDVRRANAGAGKGAGAQTGAGSREARRVALSPIKRSMVAALELAWKTPQFTQGIFVDASALVRKRAASEGKLTYMDLFLDVVVCATRQVPEVNVRFADGEAIYYDSIDVSIATDTEHGLLIPVLRDAGSMPVDKRGAAWRALVEGARLGKLAPQQMTGGVIAFSNLGTRGVDYGTPLLPTGHAAIVFIGSLATRPVVVEDKLEARPSVHVAITYDHRVIDGVLGSRFTGAVREAILTPE